MRYAFDDKGKAMNLEQFLDVVEKKRTLVANLENINYGESREVFADGNTMFTKLCIGRQGR